MNVFTKSHPLGFILIQCPRWKGVCFWRLEHDVGLFCRHTHRIVFHTDFAGDISTRIAGAAYLHCLWAGVLLQVNISSQTGVGTQFF